MSDTDDCVNEITQAARAHKHRQEGADGTDEPGRGRRWPLASIGLGVGSAALGAAVLYSDRKKRKKSQA